MKSNSLEKASNGAKELKRHKENAIILLIPVLVTAKVTEEPDSTLDFLLTEKGNLLCCKEQRGQAYKSTRPKDQYTVIPHLHDK